MKNPLHITYNDLLKEQEDRLKYMEKDYPVKVLQGSMTSWSATRKLEMQRRLVKMLKKYVKNPQLDLFELFSQTA